jgi:hypothetical protein
MSRELIAAGRASTPERARSFEEARAVPSFVDACEHGVSLGDECVPCAMDIETVAAAARAARDYSAPLTQSAAT